MPEEFIVTDAVRKSVSGLIGMAGTSGSGKTYSSLLLAAGLASGEKVGMVDAENGRGTLYQDDPVIRSVLPSYRYVPIVPDYSPARYIQALSALEKDGCKVAIVDSTSHEWEGEGGCEDIAEKNKTKGGQKNWIIAKREHKRFLLYCLSSPMHIIFCLRAREKVKKEGTEFVSIGIQPICEKNFVFEMLLSLMFDEKTHTFRGLKIPGMLKSSFVEGQLITVEHGRALRAWLNGGAQVNPADLLEKRARAHAEGGMAEYTAFFQKLSTADKKLMLTLGHDNNKAIAAQVDADNALAAEAAETSDYTKRMMKARDHPDFFEAVKALGYENWGFVPEELQEETLAKLEAELKPI